MHLSAAHLELIALTTCYRERFEVPSTMAITTVDSNSIRTPEDAYTVQ